MYSLAGMISKFRFFVQNKPEVMGDQPADL
jgi:hypothetical protein